MTDAEPREAAAETPSQRAWREALASPSFRAALDEGLADLAAGRTERWEELPVVEEPRRMSPRRRTAMANMEQQRDNWIDSAAMYARNADYWRSRAERAERFSLGRAWRLFRRVIRREALVR